MTSNGEHTNEVEQGITRHKVTVIGLTYDHETCLVSFDAHGAGLGLAQMIVDEVRRQLDIMRRQAAAIEFQKSRAEAQANAALAESILGAAGRRH